MREEEIKESLKSQLRNLKSKTLVLLVTVLSIIGVLIGYYISGSIFGSPFNDVSVDVLGDSAIRVSFETPFPAKTKIMYGTNDVYMNELDVSDSFETNHTISIKSILPQKTHVIKLFAQEADGREHISSSYKIK